MKDLFGNDVGESFIKCPKSEIDRRYRRSPNGKLTQRKMVLKKYKLTPSEWETKLKRQDYRCLICAVDLNGNEFFIRNKERKYKIRFVTDHDHISLLNRGILCDDCNQFISKAGESSEILMCAIAYLRHFSGVHCEISECLD